MVWIRRQVYRFDFSQQLPDIFHPIFYDTFYKAWLPFESLAWVNIYWHLWKHCCYLVPRLYIWRLWFIPQKKYLSVLISLDAFSYPSINSFRNYFGCALDVIKHFINTKKIFVWNSFSCIKFWLKNIRRWLVGSLWYFW